MKIDEAALGAVLDVLKGEFAPYVHLDEDQWLGVAHDVISAALPSAEPGRDRIAVVVDKFGDAFGWGVDGPVVDEDEWRSIEDNALRSVSMTGPYARAIIEVNLPRPNETPVVSGSVLRAL